MLFFPFSSVGGWMVGTRMSIEWNRCGRNVEHGIVCIVTSRPLPLSQLPRKFNPSFVTAVTAASRGDGPRPLHPIVDPSDFGGSSSQADRSVQGLDLGGVGLEIPLEVWSTVGAL